MTPRTLRRAVALAAVSVVLAACASGGDAGGGGVSGGGVSGGGVSGDGTVGAGGADGATGAPVVVGALTSLTGPFTAYGVQALAGMQLAASEINEAGGVDGRPVEIVEADDRNDPDEAVTAFERMVERDGVLAVGGVISSSVGVVVAATAEELDTPLLVVKSGSPAVLTRDSRHTFRTCLPAAPMTAAPLRQYAQDNDVGRIGAIVADYAWGRSIEAALQEAFAGTDVELQVEVAPVDTADFTTYLRSLRDVEPDLVVATGHPPGVEEIAVQAADLGLTVPVVGPYAALASVVESVGDVAYDNYADFSCVDFSSPGYQELAARFAAASDFSFMEADAVAGYAIVQLVADAVAAGATDPDEVAAHLHGTEFEMPGYSHVLSWTEFGELASAQPTLSIIRRAAPPAGVNEGADWYPEVVSTSAPLEPYVP